MSRIGHSDEGRKRSHTYEQGQKFATTFSNASEDLTMFLNRPGMGPSNNMAERSLRKVVIARKIWYILVNTTGDETFARILSCAMTWRKRGLNVHDMLMKALCGTLTVTIIRLTRIFNSFTIYSILASMVPYLPTHINPKSCLIELLLI